MTLVCVCVWEWGGCVVNVCVQQIALRSRLTFPLTALNFSQCQHCQVEREERREGGGENNVRRPGRTVSREAVRASVFWRSKASVCPPIITW